MIVYTEEIINELTKDMNESEKATKIRQLIQDESLQSLCCVRDIETYYKHYDNIKTLKNLLKMY